MAETVSNQHIEITPGVCGGKARIAGHRIRVQDIVVWHELQGLSPDEIVAQFPQITLADVYAALAYYHDHREEISQQMQDAEELVRRMMRDNPSLLPGRFLVQEGTDDPVAPG